METFTARVQERTEFFHCQRSFYARYVTTPSLLYGLSSSEPCCAMLDVTMAYLELLEKSNLPLSQIACPVSSLQNLFVQFVLAAQSDAEKKNKKTTEDDVHEPPAKQAKLQEEVEEEQEPAATQPVQPPAPPPPAPASTTEEDNPPQPSQKID